MATRNVALFSVGLLLSSCDKAPPSNEGEDDRLPFTSEIAPPPWLEKGSTDDAVRSSELKADTPQLREVTPIAEKQGKPDPFEAPRSNESPVARLNDVIRAFLTATSPEERLEHIYRSGDHRERLLAYYQEWPFTIFGEYADNMIKMETKPEFGGPYWSYLISMSDDDPGFPLIVRVENDILKVDWEVFSEFDDRHFAKFLDGTLPETGTFRVIAERRSGYYGPDQGEIADLDSYSVYEINPPYGEFEEFEAFAFVKAESPAAKELDWHVPLGTEPSEVTLELERVAVSDGKVRLAIRKFVNKGWLR